MKDEEPSCQHRAHSHDQLRPYLDLDHIAVGARVEGGLDEGRGWCGSSRTQCAFQGTAWAREIWHHEVRSTD
jgi:hypothetical protein